MATPKGGGAWRPVVACKVQARRCLQACLSVQGRVPCPPNRGTLSQQFWVAQSKSRQKQGTWRGQKREREQGIREKAEACTEMRETGESGERGREAE